jgi:hypothetical protein
LFGGWAVDFYAGSVTRAHDDLDLAAVRLELAYLVRDGEGMFTHLRHGRAAWSEEALANDTSVNCVECTRISWRLQPSSMASRRLAMILKTRRRIALISYGCPALKRDPVPQRSASGRVTPSWSSSSIADQNLIVRYASYRRGSRGTSASR